MGVKANIVGEDERYLSPAETAKRFGVTGKALRLYESHGLVMPVRTAAGWRTYGPAQIARLHQVIALKRLGLSLARIGELFKGRNVDLSAVLALQEKVLMGESNRLAGALALVCSARERLAAGAALSIDDLTQLTKETTMTAKLSNEEWKEVFDPLIRKNYAPEDLAKTDARHFSQEEVSRQWNTLFEDAKAAMAKGDPYSAEALDVARRWSALVNQFTQGDPKLHEGASKVWKDAFADPNIASRLPVKAELFAFVAKGMQRLKASG